MSIYPILWAIEAQNCYAQKLHKILKKNTKIHKKKENLPDFTQFCLQKAVKIALLFQYCVVFVCYAHKQCNKELLCYFIKIWKETQKYMKKVRIYMISQNFALLSNIYISGIIQTPVPHYVCKPNFVKSCKFDSVPCIFVFVFKMFIIFGRHKWSNISGWVGVHDCSQFCDVVGMYTSAIIHHPIPPPK